MAVLQLDDVLQPDDLAVGIARNYQTWNQLRQVKISEWEEVRKYVYATDTTETTNAQLPWKNKTTVPKLTQIRDNLYANYMKSLFPKRKWLAWEAYDDKSGTVKKRTDIENFMYWVIDRSDFKKEISKLILDYIDYGNSIGMPDWVDERQQLPDRDQIGFVGPVARRLSPVDIVFNPTAASFKDAPKIVRSLVSLGEVKELITRLSQTEEQDPQKLDALFKYILELRQQANTLGSGGDNFSKDVAYQVDGFSDYRQYLASDLVEVLTFYGDLYDKEKDEFYRNHIFTVVDRHKLLDHRPNPSFFGRPPVYHVGWRTRQDNLWAMGPLDNLVGLQYRIDHLENLKADIFDLTAFPPLKIKGLLVDDFEWGPFSRIYVGDDGDVEILSPDVNALNTNLEINLLEQKMEEMAGAPKEALGFRTPGEKTKYEVQRLENAASRIFQSKIENFEEYIIEPLLNSMLELARRNMTSEMIRVYDDEFDIETFQKLTAADITGNGKIRCLAASHFAEQSEKVQNATAFFNSQVGMDPSVLVHISGQKTAEMMESLLELDGFDLVTPFIRVTEQAEAERLKNSADEQTLNQQGTPTGIEAGDHTAPQQIQGMNNGARPTPNPTASVAPGLPRQAVQR